MPRIALPMRDLCRQEHREHVTGLIAEPDYITPGIQGWQLFWMISVGDLQAGTVSVSDTGRQSHRQKNLPTLGFATPVTGAHCPSVRPSSVTPYQAR